MRIKVTKVNEHTVRISTPKECKVLTFKTEFQVKEYAKKISERFATETVRLVGFDGQA